MQIDDGRRPDNDHFRCLRMAQVKCVNMKKRMSEMKIKSRIPNCGSGWV
jgi:hypothetical protein